LQIISDELKKYPEVEFVRSEPGMTFRVNFLKKEFKHQQELQQELQQESLYGKVLNLIQARTSSKRTFNSIRAKEHFRSIVFRRKQT
jgi:ATP-dependent DNA helicase RecG